MTKLHKKCLLGDDDSSLKQLHHMRLGINSNLQNDYFRVNKNSFFRANIFEIGLQTSASDI